MRLYFDYKMKIAYSQPVALCHFTIKCIPKTDARQQLVDHKITLVPSAHYMIGTDSFENAKIYGHVKEGHDEFHYRIQGNVEILQTQYEEKAENIGIYKYPFGLCVSGNSLKYYYHSLSLNSDSAYQTSLYIMNQIYHDFQYRPLTTEIHTNAEQAWQQRMGVCQDYAHIFITLLRMAGIPARYVCGFLIGEGASHAWVEVCIDGYWIGMDPTNNCLVTNDHIKLSHGRDANDCAINRGIVIGNGLQSQEISVCVKRRETL